MPCTTPRLAHALALLMLAACSPVPTGQAEAEAPLSSSAPLAAQSADSLYFGGPILTMEGDSPRYAEAVSVKDGKILAVGDKADVLKAQGNGTRMIDLQGRVLLPGFIDAHGHVFNAGVQKLAANLLPPPDGTGRDIPTLIALLKKWQSENAVAIQKTGWILGFGYDDSQLSEQRHPTAAELDQVSTDVPVVVIHQSGHLGAMNHKALEVAGFNADSKDPAGGAIRREKDGRTPNGVLEGTAIFGPTFRILGALDPDSNQRIALAGVDAYVRFGFTTAQEGRANKSAAEAWRTLASRNQLKIDVAVYPDLQMETAYMKQVGTTPTYDHHFRIAGVKLNFDGSPQGRTAWLTKPYLVPPPGQPKDYRGVSAIPKAEDRQALVDLAFENHWQLITHCNGDAAADALIDAVTNAEAKYGKADRRTVMIHAQTVREDQLDRMKELGIIPSFFSMHTYYWGDWHRDVTLGKERAYRISPAASALKRGMIFTDHHDAPVALPSAAMILYTMVNRISRSGDIIGPDQRVSPYVALKSITDWAAYQYFEETRKGTITPGKLADFVILDKDPTRIDPTTIKDLRVMQTIKEGEPVYTAK
jgi:predicted amidohydrolase YtcJ